MVSLLVSIVFTVVICGFAVWVLRTLVPAHPPIIDNAIWVLCAFVVLLTLVAAFGLVDIPVPQIR